MRWPWQRSASGELLVCSWEAHTLAFVVAKQNNGVWTISSMGAESQGTDSTASFVQRLKELGLKGMQVAVMLRPDQYQFLQIDKPSVPPEELRAAARYQVREMLKAHVDDVTIDVVDVGDGQHQQGGSHSFVAAALNSVVREVTDLAQALGWQMSVIDIQEMAQRNLQSLVSKQSDPSGRANAALVVVPGQQALLTICANDELFYTRRFDVPEGFFTSVWGQGMTVSAPVDGFTPVEEYVPSYGMGDLSLGEDYSAVDSHPVKKNEAFHAEDDQAQRLLVEVQRSLDVWDRTWSSLPLGGLRVYAGERSVELAQWLSAQLGQKVTSLDVGGVFPGFDTAPVDTQTACLPLLGILLRMEGHTS